MPKIIRKNLLLNIEKKKKEKKFFDQYAYFVNEEDYLLTKDDAILVDESKPDEQYQ